MQKITKFWTVFFGSLALLAIVFAIGIGVVGERQMRNMSASVVSDDNVYKIDAENGFRQALFQASDSLKNIDTDLSKASVSSSNKAQAGYLLNASIHCESVGESLSDLPVSFSGNLESITKFVNQTGDFSAYLVKKLADGEDISAKEISQIKSLKRIASRLQSIVRDMADDGFMFVTNGTFNGGSGFVNDEIQDIDENVFKYEKLIYDGPFSDSVKNEKPTAKAVSEERGKQIVQDAFSAYGVSNVEYGGVMSGENFAVFNAESQMGQMRILLSGEKVVEMNLASQRAGRLALGKEKCIDLAENFARKLGYDVKGIWVSKTDGGLTYVNLAPVEEDATVYPDLIKVAVDTTSGVVVGMEARAYLANHHERSFSAPVLTAKQAVATVKANPTNVKKAIIEKFGKEYLCYEVEFNDGENQYFSYVNAETGEEMELFKVINGTEGYTVM